MKFQVHLKDCAANNVASAHRRECTRVASIAWCLNALGHEVSIVNISPAFRGTPNWQYFKHLWNPRGDGLSVKAAEVAKSGGRGDIGIKCSVGTRCDGQMLADFGLLVAHEYNDGFHNHNRLLPVPFLVHNTVLEYLMTAGLFDAYLANDIDTIRHHFAGARHSQRVGFIGASWPNRKALCEPHPDWASATFYNDAMSNQMKMDEHCRWLMGFDGALAMRGDTPKTNLPPLLAMLGIPMFLEPMVRRDTSPMDETNTIPFTGWDAVESVLNDPERLKRVSDKATADYLSSWSPMGQARLIVERLQ